LNRRITTALGFMLALSAMALCVGYCASKPGVKPIAKLAPNLIPTMEMIYIPAGSFDMGTPDGQIADPAEPHHSVTLSAYHIGKYEVTRGQYRQFMKAGGYSNSAYWSRDGWSWKVDNGIIEPAYWAATQTWASRQTFTQTDSHPVVGVSYYEAEAFCKWAGGHLPTEAQWERAAGWTGTHARVYPWGDERNAEECNTLYDHNAAGGGVQRFQTAPVGSYPAGASASGCQDMAGNVHEWCRDWYDYDYYSQSPARDPQGSPKIGIRVSRGGGWGAGLDRSTRCATRGLGSPTDRINSVGFRLAR
jgi:iron(II)-dependent oxidoreductase